MLVPSSLLAQRLIVEPYLGHSATGPVYGAPVGVRARIEGKRRVVRRIKGGVDTGTEVVSTTSAMVRPGLALLPESKATIPQAYSTTGADQELEVLAVFVGQGLRRPAYLDLVLG